MSTPGALGLQRPAGHVAGLVGVLVGMALVAGLAAPLIVDRPGTLRLLFAAAIAFALVVAVLADPARGALATLGFLVVLALVRRLLIGPAGWSGADPLLLVGPLVAAVLVVRFLVLERRPLAPDGISMLVTGMVALSVLQLLNPSGGGIAPGLGGLLFVCAPLLWFYIGRETASEQLAGRALALLVVGGTAVALYGLAQTQVGFPAWDRAWLAVNGYDSLNVGETKRAFGSFSSSGEYAFFLGSALAAAAGLLMLGRGRVVLLLPVLALGLFLASARGPLITAVAAILILAGLRSGGPRRAVVITIVALALAVGGLKLAGPALSGAAGSSNDLVAHQLEGVTDPLDPGDSTLLLHLELVIAGFERGVVAPLGSGTGAANNAASKLGGGQATSQTSEVDISNAFITLGLLGGLTYLALVVLVLRRTLQGWYAGHRLMLPVFALLAVSFGQWLIGGHYALAPLTWLLIGYVAAVTRRASQGSPNSARSSGVAGVERSRGHSTASGQASTAGS